MANKKEAARNQKLQKRAAELVSKYGDKCKVEVKDNKMNRFVRSTNFKYHIKEGEEKLNMWASTAFDPENNHSESVQKKLGQIGLDAARREMDKARTDSFATATRNTYNYLKKNRQKR